MATSDRIFLSPKGKDNQTRLSAIIALSLIDVQSYVEQALQSGAKSGTVFTQTHYMQLMELLTTALRASTTLNASLEIITSSEAYDSAQETIKDRFNTYIEARDKGQL